jgi:hypothetical protein
MNNNNHPVDLIPVENPDGQRPRFAINRFLAALPSRQRRGFEREALYGLMIGKARELAEVDCDAEIRVRQAVVSELVDGAIFDSRGRLVRRIAPELFGTQREVFDRAKASGLGRTKLEETLVGLGVSALQMLLLGGLPQGATVGQEALIDNAFRTVDLSRGVFSDDQQQREDIWTE